MSDQSSQPAHGQPIDQGIDQPVDHAVEPTTAGRRRGVVAPIASAVAVVLVAGGGFAAWRFFADPGTAPAEVLPSGTFALATVDLDPSGGQKVEAYQALRKFPALRKQLGADSGGDLVEKLVTESLKDGPCKSLSYARDFEPWIGQSFAAGGVELGDAKPTWVVAVETKDADKATSSFGKVASCAAEDGGKVGWTVAGDYVIASDSKSHADAIAAAGAKDPLSSDAAYQKWMGEAASDAGIASFYVAQGAPKIFGKLMDEEMTRSNAELDKASAEDRLRYEQQIKDLPAAQREKLLKQFDDEVSDFGMPEQTKPSESLRETFKDFTGMAGVMRFGSGGVELSMAGGGVNQTGSHEIADHVSALPGDTAAVLAFSPPEELVTQLSEPSGAALGPFGGLFSLPALAKEAGLTLPDDLETLLGSGLSLSLGGQAPADLDKAKSTDVPFGVLVDTDPAKFQAVVAKVEKATGMQLSAIPASLQAGDGSVAVASNPQYAEQLTAKGDLGSQQVFKDVVPHADKATGIVFAQLDGSWRAAIQQAAKDSGDKDDRAFADNLDAVRALGASTWQDGSVSHGLVRLSLR